MKEHLQNGRTLKKEASLLPPGPLEEHSVPVIYCWWQTNSKLNGLKINNYILLLSLMVLGSTRKFSFRESLMKALSRLWLLSWEDANSWRLASGALRCLSLVSLRGLSSLFASGKPEFLCGGSGLQRCAERWMRQREGAMCYYDLASELTQHHFCCILFLEAVTRRGETDPTSWWRCGKGL